MIKYLNEIKTEFENTVACLSGVQMGSNHKKTGGRKSRDTITLIILHGRGDSDFYFGKGGQRSTVTDF